MTLDVGWHPESAGRAALFGRQQIWRAAQPGLEALCAHIPGLKVLYPATPHDTKGLMASVLSSDNPAVLFKSQRLYVAVEMFRPEGVPG